MYNNPYVFILIILLAFSPLIRNGVTTSIQYWKSKKSIKNEIKNQSEEEEN